MTTSTLARHLLSDTEQSRPTGSALTLGHRALGVDQHQALGSQRRHVTHCLLWLVAFAQTAQQGHGHFVARTLLHAAHVQEKMRQSIGRYLGDRLLPLYGVKQKELLARALAVHFDDVAAGLLVQR